MTEEQKQALIEWLKPQIDELQNVSDEVPFGLDSDSAMHLNTMRVALAALTAQPDDWKQRAEAAEAKLAGVNDEAAHERNLRSKFETDCKLLQAKLAELEKQEPVGKQYRVSAKGNEAATGWSIWTAGAGEKYAKNYNVQVREVFTRPAPAADLADLVPEEMTPDMMKAVQCNSELGAYAAANLAGAYDLFDEFWKVARATMLRKIEEAK